VALRVTSVGETAKTSGNMPTRQVLRSHSSASTHRGGAPAVASNGLEVALLGVFNDSTQRWSKRRLPRRRHR